MAIRRDVLKRKVDSGLMEAKSYSLSSNFKPSQWLPARLAKNRDDSKSGYMNFTAFDFQSRSGSARKNADGTITLSVHSNLWFTLRPKRAHAIVTKPQAKTKTTMIRKAKSKPRKT